MKIIHESDHTKVALRDNHYEIIGKEIPEEFAWVDFQKGPIQEAGVNGCQIEDLLAICIHHAEEEQKGDRASSENAEALYHMNLAIKYLSDGPNPIFSDSRS